MEIQDRDIEYIKENYNKDITKKELIRRFNKHFGVHISEDFNHSGSILLLIEEVTCALREK